MFKFFIFLKSFPKNLLFLIVIYLLFSSMFIVFDMILHNLANNHYVNPYQLNEYYIVQKLFFVYVIITTVLLIVKGLTMYSRKNENFFSFFILFALIGELVFFLMFYHQLDNISYNLYGEHVESVLNNFLVNNETITNNTSFNISAFMFQNLTNISFKGDLICKSL